MKLNKFVIPTAFAFLFATVGVKSQTIVSKSGGLGSGGSVTGPILFPDGTANNPSISFTSNPDTGLYLVGSATIVSTDGTANVAFNYDSAGQVKVASNGQFGFASGVVTNTADTTLARVAAGKLLLSGTTPMFLLGGSTSSFPAIKQSSTQLQIRLADDSNYAPLAASQIISDSFLNKVSGNTLYSGAGPSAPSACGTSPVVTSNNGTAAFVITGGTGGTATGCTITLPTAGTGWVCSITNVTQTAAHRADRTTVQTGSTTTSATWEYQVVSTGAATAFTASDVFRGICFAY